METLEEYKELLTTELKRRVGLTIEDTRLDNDELLQSSFKSGETVKELIDWLVEKDDLTEIPEYHSNFEPQSINEFINGKGLIIEKFGSVNKFYKQVLKLHNS